MIRDEDFTKIDEAALAVLVEAKAIVATFASHEGLRGRDLNGFDIEYIKGCTQRAHKAAVVLHKEYGD